MSRAIRTFCLEIRKEKKNRYLIHREHSENMQPYSFKQLLKIARLWSIIDRRCTWRTNSFNESMTASPSSMSLSIAIQNMGSAALTTLMVSSYSSTTFPSIIVCSRHCLTTCFSERSIASPLSMILSMSTQKETNEVFTIAIVSSQEG